MDSTKVLFLQALTATLLLVPLAAASQETVNAEPDPLMVIVSSSGKWTRVTMVEERNGSIIYQKPGGSPRAAKEHSLDIATTMNVNVALADFTAACAGSAVDLSRMFTLTGRSKLLFFTVASRHSKTCLHNLFNQYQSELNAHNRSLSTGQLQDVARSTSIKATQNEPTVISNENLSRSSENPGRSPGKVEHAPGTAYGRCLDANLPNVVQAFNAIVPPEESDLDRDSWASATLAECDRMVSATDAVKDCVPNARYSAAHSKVIVAMDVFRRAAIDIKSGILENDDVAIEIGYEAKLDGLHPPFTDALTALDKAASPSVNSSATSTGAEEFFAGDVPATVKSFCEEKWGTNYEMQSYCRKEQFEAIEKLKTTNPYSRGLNPGVFQEIRAGCKKKWQPNYEMREYCEDNQIEAFRGLNN